MRYWSKVQREHLHRSGARVSRTHQTNNLILCVLHQTLFYMLFTIFMSNDTHKQCLTEQSHTLGLRFVRCLAFGSVTPYIAVALCSVHELAHEKPKSIFYPIRANGWASTKAKPNVTMRYSDFAEGKRWNECKQQKSFGDVYSVLRMMRRSYHRLLLNEQLSREYEQIHFAFPQIWNEIIPFQKQEKSE